MASTRSSRTFFLNFWFLPVFVVVLLLIRLIDYLCMTNLYVFPWGIFERIYLLPLKAIETNGKIMEKNFKIIFRKLF